MSDEDITFSIEEKEQMEKDLTKISDYQRLSSILGLDWINYGCITYCSRYFLSCY